MFQAVKSCIHSSGGEYLTILNLPCDIQYLAKNAPFPLAISGPYEPSLKQLNKFMDPADKHATTLDGFSQIFHNFIRFNTHILSDRNRMTPMHSHIVTGFRQVIDRFRMISDA